MVKFPDNTLCWGFGARAAENCVIIENSNGAFLCNFRAPPVVGSADVTVVHSKCRWKSNRAVDVIQLVLSLMHSGVALSLSEGQPSEPCDCGFRVESLRATDQL